MASTTAMVAATIDACCPTQGIESHVIERDVGAIAWGMLVDAERRGRAMDPAHIAIDYRGARD